MKVGCSMKNDRYSMTFSTGGLFLREAVILAELYLEHQSWDPVRTKVLSDNLLQARTMASAQRVYREICARLKTLSCGEIRLFVEGSPPEQAHLLWISICRRFTFIAEFAVEVLREHYISLKSTVKPEDFDFFFNKKSEWHPELDEITLKTRIKLRQVLFRMMREAGLVTPEGMIIAVILSPRIQGAIPRERQQDILLFPAFESDIMGRQP